MDEFIEKVERFDNLQQIKKVKQEAINYLKKMETELQQIESQSPNPKLS